MNGFQEFYAVPNWYQTLSDYTFDTKFVKLRLEAVAALAAGGEENRVDMESDVSKQVISELDRVMDNIPGGCFVSVDCCAPTDTERFKNKGGSVFSAKSAWYFLAASAKVAGSAAAGDVSCICVRPYRNVSKAREFRLFIKDGGLAAMSQYNLIRHFRRLVGVQERYWQYARQFVEEISWRLPVKTLVMDIYFTHNEDILIFDLNPWGEPTSPLLLRSWERDWSKPAGLLLIPPPTKISGSVKVSF